MDVEKWFKEKVLEELKVKSVEVRDRKLKDVVDVFRSGLEYEREMLERLKEKSCGECECCKRIVREIVEEEIGLDGSVESLMMVDGMGWVFIELDFYSSGLIVDDKDEESVIWYLKMVDDKYEIDWDFINWKKKMRKLGDEVL